MTLPALQPLLGCRIDRVDMPRAGLLCLGVSSSLHKGVLAIALTKGRGLGWLERRPRGEPASAFVQQLRKHLRGSRLHDARMHDGACMLELRRGEQRRQLALEAENVVLIDEADTVMGAWQPGSLQRRGLRTRASYRPPPTTAALQVPGSFDGLRRAGPMLVAEGSQSELEQQRRTLRRAVTTRERALKRRLEAIRSDAARAERSDALRLQASTLLARLHEIDSEATRVRVEALDGSTRELAIDPRLGPAAQADAWFHKARRLERGARIAAEREALTIEEQRRLRALQARIDAAEGPATLRELRDEARRLGCKVPARALRPHKTRPRARLPYRCFLGEGEHPIWVGRSAADNDQLLREARPYHLWLHARDVRGAHVVVPLQKHASCPPQLLADAAMLAAHFSDARHEPRTDVIYAARRYIRKPKGASAGLAIAEREKVFPLRVDRTRLDELLVSEIKEA